jgi:hypothetical protein
MASYMIYLLTAGLLVLIFWNSKDNLKQITTNQETQANLTKDSEQKRNKDENPRKENFFTITRWKYQSLIDNMAMNQLMVVGEYM